MRRTQSFGKSSKDRQNSKYTDKTEPRKVKPLWNSELVDQSNYKLTPDEVYKRHLIHKSKNIQAAKLSLIKKSLDFTSSKPNQSWIESPMKIKVSTASSVTVAPTFLNDVRQGLVVNLQRETLQLLNANEELKTKPSTSATIDKFCEEFDSLSLNDRISQLKLELEKERTARLKVENEVTELRMLVSQVIKEVLEVRCTLDKDFIEKIPDPISLIKI